MEAMRKKLKTPGGKKTYQKRMYTVEPVFGNMQGNQGKIALSLRGLIMGKGEFLLRCLVNNIRKIVRKVLACAITLDVCNNSGRVEISKDRRGGAGKSGVRRRVQGISA
jgi:hypothetical protein